MTGAAFLAGAFATGLLGLAAGGFTGGEALPSVPPELLLLCALGEMTCLFWR